MSDGAYSVNAIPSVNGDGRAAARRPGRLATARPTPARRRPGSGRVQACGVARLLYNTAYAVSYGVVFPIAYVARATPIDNPAVQGIVEGADAASQKVDDLLNRR